MQIIVNRKMGSHLSMFTKSLRRHDSACVSTYPPQSATNAYSTVYERPCMTCMRGSRDPHSPFSLHARIPRSLLLYPIVLFSSWKVGAAALREQSPDATNVRQDETWDRGCGVGCRAADKTRQDHCMRLSAGVLTGEGVDNSPISRYRWQSFYLVNTYDTRPSDKPIHLRDIHTR